MTQVLSQYANSTRTVLLSKAAALVWNICGIPSNVVRVEKERTMEELLRVWKFHANNAELVGNCAGACSVLIRKRTSKPLTTLALTHSISCRCWC